MAVKYAHIMQLIVAGDADYIVNESCFNCSNSVLCPDGCLRCKFTNLLAIKLCVKFVSGNGENLSIEELVILNQKGTQKVTKQTVKVKPIITKPAAKKAKSTQQGKLL